MAQHASNGCHHMMLFVSSTCPGGQVGDGCNDASIILWHGTLSGGALPCLSWHCFSPAVPVAFWPHTLARQQLRQDINAVFAVADVSKSGWLTKSEFMIAMIEWSSPVHLLFLSICASAVKCGQIEMLGRLLCSRTSVGVCLQVPLDG